MSDNDHPSRRRPVREPLPMTAEQERMVGKLRRFAVQYERAQETLARMTEERTDWFLACRELDPPLQFRVIAETFSVTEAAVMQAIKRREVAEAAEAS